MMRKYLIISVVSCVPVVLAGCQQRAKMAEGPAAAGQPKAGPKIEFESTVCDFGRVGPSKKLDGEFKFTNAGDEPLRITNIEKCCGAVVKLDKGKFAPGESGVLHVQYTSSRGAGTIRNKLYVDSNDKTNPRTTLTVQAETVLRVDYQPKTLTLLPKRQNAGCSEIVLTSKENKPFSIKQVEVTNRALVVDFDSSAESTKFVLQPKADIEKLLKVSTGIINIALAFPEPDGEFETVTILFHVLSRFTIIPSILMVIYDKPDEPIKKTLSITNNYGEDFEVESTASKEGIITVLKQDKIGKRYRFELQITPNSGRDDKKFTDTFTINLKGGEKLEVPCRGIYRAPKPKAGG
jgi:hypothetical protein